MYYILGSDQKEYGPIGSDVLKSWYQEHRIDSKTMVRREGEADWKLLSSLSEFSYLFQQHSRPPDLVSADPKDLEARVFSTDRSIDAMGYIRKSYELYKANFGPLFIATLVVLAIIGASGSIPGGFLITGIVQAGLYWFFLKWIRGSKAELGDVFAGFQRQPGQLILASLVMGIVPVIVVFIVGAPFWIPFFATAIGSASTGTNPETILSGLGWLGCLGIGIGCLAAFALYVMWMFAYPLIIDKGLKFWPAMELSRKVVMKSFFGYVWLNVLCGLIAMLGIIACFVGVIFVAPVCAGAIAYAYEDTFGRS
ncbi:GYF domain-containing protein [bacterium]|nr:GYF domain-containing protein [bacterium]